MTRIPPTAPAPHAAPQRLRPVARRLRALLVLALPAAFLPAAPDSIQGLPFTRSYPLAEIGSVSRSARLGFDRFGRIALIQEGAYSVLNDTAWIDLAPASRAEGMLLAGIARGADGHDYYAGRGSWGRVAPGPDGRLRPDPLVPAEAPPWTHTASFGQVLGTAEGVYFAGREGVVYLDFDTGRCHYFPIPAVAAIFPAAGQVFASPHGAILRRLDIGSDTTQPVPGGDFGGAAVEYATPIDEGHTLIAVRDGRLLVFDGKTTTPWAPQSHHDLTGTVSALQRLADGGIAVAIVGKGLFLVAPDGDLTLALTTPPYHRITAMAARESGVLWVTVEDAVEKILYGSPLTAFGQRLGLPVTWPVVAATPEAIVVATGGRLYRSLPGLRGVPTRFAAVPEQPTTGCWATVAVGKHLLVGNSEGVYERLADGHFARVLALRSIVHLVAAGDDLCYVLGEHALTALRWQGDRWIEVAKRIPVSRPPAIVHGTGRDVWIEYGTNQIGHAWFDGPDLRFRLFDHLPWQESDWVNLGFIGDVVVLSGPLNGRRFLDASTGEFREEPALDRLLARAPNWITRVVVDAAGNLWATHSQGVVVFRPDGHGNYTLDTTTFDLVNDYYPQVHLLGDDVWIVSSRLLYHVDPRRPAEPRTEAPPCLVSLLNERTNRDLVAPDSASTTRWRLPFNENALSFRFFSGGYAWRRAPTYEYRLNHDSWVRLPAGSPLSLSGLREGAYHLEARLTNPTGTALNCDFTILPPWHRTPSAFGVYALGLFGVIVGLMRWSGLRARRRNAALEALVGDRTRQLEATMRRLNEETRNAATLAERDRLAGEIHDSLQQGLSGLMLQLDATLKQSTLSDDVRDRLVVARNMVSFTRHEVQHAVWDMESPLIENADLGEALRKLAGLIHPGDACIEISVTGEAAPLSSTAMHHLLRVAQEAITNAVRHAQATVISLALEQSAVAVTLTITDDGVGFEPSVRLKAGVGHFGLRGMRTRAAKIGARLAIGSTPALGTRIQMVLPLPNTLPLAPISHGTVPSF